MSRTLVIGLDGVPRSLAARLAADGTMPTLAELAAGATLAELVVPVPEISSTSWASFLTGVNPGRHRVFGFIDVRPGSYDVFFPGVRHLGARPLWEWVGRNRMRSICLNVPGTYPAVAVPTGMVSGFVAPEFDAAVQPPRWRPLLREIGYQLDVEVGDVGGDPAGFIDRIEAALAARTEAFVRLLSEEPYDLAVAVITETDRLQHFLWRDVVDPDGRWHERVMGVYRRVDQAVARLLATLHDDDEVFLVSDHGFTRVDRQFYVNAWLRARGDLILPVDSPDLSGIDGSTRAFALDPARIYLNRAGRFPAGTLTDAGADEVAGDLTQALLDLRVDGRPVVAEVLRGPVEYSGPFATDGPDLLCLPGPGTQLRGAWSAAEALAPDVLTGGHTRDDALFLRRGRRLKADRYDMVDVLPALLDSVGVATGSLCDGEVPE